MIRLSPIAHHWRQLRGSDRYAECLRVFLALGGIILYCLASGQSAALTPAMLGVIACALAETEDRWRSRLTTLLLTLACFATAAFAVEWLLPYPLLFAAGLLLATFTLVMLGAVSGRYATIAGATLLLAVYTMIVTDQPGGPPRDAVREPLLLLAGAAWYGVLSLLWSALSPQRAVRHALARLFDALADYLDSKAALFAPVRGVDQDALQLALAMRNEQVVDALNDVRLILIDRIGIRRPRGMTATRLQLYFMAQDIHERVSSSHHPYAALTETFFHSDVLFRCERLLRMEARSCRQRAEALRLHTTIEENDDARAALDDVRASIAALSAQPHPPSAHLLRSLEALLRNMTAIQAQLENDAPLATTVYGDESALQDPTPQSVGEAWARIRIQLTPRSLRFRHALRLAIALTVGYGVLHLIHPRNGYWILMTTLLVCQPSYGAAQKRMLERVAGTVLGLVAGWAILRLLPLSPWQIPLIVVSGVVFFAARLRQYPLATAAITVFVMLSFNQVGNGYGVMWPRLLDTLIGTSIAALAIHFILPEWQGRQLNQVLSDAVRNDARYLEVIIAQYASGKRDDLDYRIARRDAHNANATLSGVLANMLREPGQRSQGNEDLLRFLAAAHTLLGHLSTLGVHRQVIGPAPARDAVVYAGTLMAGTLERLADALASNTPLAPVAHDTELPAAMAADGIDDETARLVLGQLALVLAQHDRLAALADTIRAG